MSRRLSELAVLTIGAAAAGWPQPPARGSISGVVRIEAAGVPYADVAVLVAAAGGRASVGSRPDSEGRYKVSNLPPGDYNVSAVSVGGVLGLGRLIRLAPGQEYHLDLIVPSNAGISGKVIDENDEPVPRVWVWLVRKEYRAGTLVYMMDRHFETNERGEYAIVAPPGRPYLLMARAQGFPTDAPAPKERKPVFLPAYFPGTDAPEAAETIMLRPGERREAINIRLKRSPAYCAGGVVDEEGKPRAIEFEFTENGPSGGAPLMRSGADGRFRICGLHPGDYRLTIAGGTAAEGSWTLITVRDEDRHDLKIHADAVLPPPGEIAWDGDAPDKPLKSELKMAFRSLGDGLRLDVVAPLEAGPFHIPVLSASDYEVRVTGLPAGMYVKDIAYGGRSVLAEPLRFGGGSTGGAVRVALARDGGLLQAQVADKDENPVPQAWVYLMPEGITSPAELSAAMVSGRTDAAGAFVSPTLRPGKYYVLASETEVFPTPEGMGALLRARGRASEVDVGPKGTAVVKLELTSIE